ncbi:sensor histidine kinase [Deminuibacter soli]|uniref:histidine kinase n=1 Tax=Deminuibacter soli TaxID=2291815 RepID=A0A3E1NLA3_9BACT|nr:sensor histidine kinase [Deminuibacter soli]RFM28624.1 hypothetical protein DXN05_07460 [Deminuibacter soli]
MAYTGFIVSLLIITLLSWLYHQQYTTMLRYTAAVEHSYRAIAEVNRFASQVKDVETAERGYLLTHDSSFLLPYNDAVKSIEESLDSLASFTRDNPLLQQQVMSLRYTTQKRLLNLSGNSLNQLAGNPSLVSFNLLEGKMVMDTIKSAVSTLTRSELELLQERNNARESYQLAVPKILMVLLVFSSSLLLVSFVVIVQVLRKRKQYLARLETSNYELQANNEELAQIAKVVSHDLQEPLRKIRTFNNRMVIKHRESLTPDARQILGRLDEAVIRMQALVEDLMNYTSLTGNTDTIATVSLNDVVKRILQYYQPEIMDKKATIQVGPLLDVQGYDHQVFIALAAVVENALKFSSADTPLVIRINGRMDMARDAAPDEKRIAENKYYIVQIADNGIGFNDIFREKIFDIFQRLHSGEAQYEGKGIGLAIVRKVMHNHHGFVRAEGRENDGAMFCLYFPV